MGSKNLSLVASLQIHSTTHLSSVFSKAYTLPCLLGVTCLVRQPSRIVRRRGTPLIKPPCASERPLFDRSSINSFPNFVWAQGPWHSAPSPRTEALYSRQLVRGARALDLGPSLAVDALRHFPDTPIPHRYHSLLCGPDYHERQEWPILQSELFIRPSV